MAFILYLVPPWQSSDGGTLDLYSTDGESSGLCAALMSEDQSDARPNVLFLTSGNFQPQSVVKALVPSFNTLVLFEVSPVSFHQVGCCCFSHPLLALFYTLVTHVCVY